MSYDIKFIEQARKLRSKGYSFAEIAKKFRMAKSTASVWTNSIKLNKNARKRLLNRSINGRLKSVAYFKRKRTKELHENQRLARIIIKSVKSNKNFSKIACSLLYWCEGSKRDLIIFTSSDPDLMQTFLIHLRCGFEIDEMKFRALMHLHQYHNEEKQKLFWQKITKIPSGQFNKTYWKPNTGKNSRPGYPGCLAVTYLDAKVAKQIAAIYNTFGNSN